MTRRYFIDLLERVFATLLEAIAGALVGVQVIQTSTGAHLEGLVHLQAVAAVAGVAAGVTLLKGIAASLRGDPNSASFATTVTNAAAAAPGPQEAPPASPSGQQAPPAPGPETVGS